MSVSSISGGGGGQYVSQVSSSADGVIGQIQTAAAQGKQLQADLAGLIAELQAESEMLSSLKGGKPAAPGEKASDEEKAKFAQASAEWQKKIDACMARIDQLRDRIEVKEKEIDKNAALLSELQNVKLPAAQAKDQAELDAQVQREKEAADGQAKASTDTRVDADPNVVEKKKAIFGVTTGGAFGLPLSDEEPVAKK